MIQGRKRDEPEKDNCISAVRGGHGGGDQHGGRPAGSPFAAAYLLGQHRHDLDRSFAWTLVWNASQPSKRRPDGNDHGHLFSVLCPGGDGHRVYEWSGVAEMDLEKAGDRRKGKALAVGIGCGDPGNHSQLSHLRRGVWGSHLLRVHGAGTAFGKDANRDDSQHFSGADRDGLFGPGAEYDAGVSLFAGASCRDAG